MRSVLCGNKSEVNIDYRYMLSAWFDNLAGFTDFVLENGAESFFNR